MSSLWQLRGEEALSFQADAVRPTAGGISSAMTAAIGTDLPFYPAPQQLRGGPPWRPRGTLLAHLAEHKAAVNRIAIARNGAFLATASNDETVKIWDCRRLQKDVSFRSRLTYSSQGGRILACAACVDAQSVASASDNGTLHVWNVEYMTRPGGAPDRYTGLVGNDLLRKLLYKSTIIASLSEHLQDANVLPMAKAR